ncbi:MAG: lysine 2,3-aminomutase [Planctomycetota bacterium]|nr:lysine 2,3-aminomutase [Planctomycetota bacterium]
MPQWGRLDPEVREAVEVVSLVLPFRTNAYVMEELIDWRKTPDDPMFQLTFPQRGMLSDAQYEAMASLVRAEAPREVLKAEANRIRAQLNPHPAGQMTHNVPRVNGRPLPGVQHKYRETVLFFPSHGQTCHAYCTFCFRWAQFVGLEDLKFASREAGDLVAYLREHPDVTDVLLTGGDPMVMKSRVLRKYVEPLLELEQLITIRIGTKSIAYWPHRYVTDQDADDVLELFEQVVDAGKQLAVMAHASHPVENSTDMAREAVRRIRATGANIRMQSPVVRHVNDEPQVWADLWRDGVRIGCIPYYMFVERDTGARGYFEIPLARCWDIFQNAYREVSGMCRTVRGPSMSAFPGKVHVLGLTTIGGEKAFALEYLQAREAGLVRRPFFARFDPTATWFDQLRPLTERDRPFFPAAPARSDATPTVVLTTSGEHAARGERDC